MHVMTIEKKRVLLIGFLGVFLCAKHGSVLAQSPSAKLGSLHTSLTDLRGRLEVLKEKLTCLRSNSVIGTLEAWAARCFALPEFKETVHPFRETYSFAHKIPEITKEKFMKALGDVITINKKKRFEGRVVFKPSIQDGGVLVLCGDIHGSIHALMRILRSMKKEGLIDNNFKLKPWVRLIFLGDYEDRGRYGVEVIYTLMHIKIQNEDNVDLLCGNHDGSDNNSENFGFKYEIIKKMRIAGADLEVINQQIYDALPVVGLCLVKNDTRDRVFCCHGYIPLEEQESFKEALANTSDYFTCSDDLMASFVSIYTNMRVTDLVTRSLEYYGIQAVFRGHSHGKRTLTVFDSDSPRDGRGILPVKSYVGESTFKAIGEYATIPVYTLTNCPEFDPGEGYAVVKINGPYRNWQMKIVDLTEKHDDNYGKLSSLVGAQVCVEGEAYRWVNPQICRDLLLPDIIAMPSFKDFTKENPARALDFLINYIQGNGESRGYGGLVMVTNGIESFLKIINEKKELLPADADFVKKIRDTLPVIDSFGGVWLGLDKVDGDENKAKRRAEVVENFRRKVKVTLEHLVIQPVIESFGGVRLGLDKVGGDELKAKRRADAVDEFRREATEGLSF